MMGYLFVISLIIISQEMKNGQDIPLIFLKGGRNLKTLVEGKDYSVHEYVTKDKRKDNNRPMCPICSNCNHKEFCANRKKLFKMKECEDCSNCKDKEHCDKFYIYLFSFHVPT